MLASLAVHITEKIDAVYKSKTSRKLPPPHSSAQVSASGSVFVIPNNIMSNRNAINSS